MIPPSIQPLDQVAPGTVVARWPIRQVEDATSVLSRRPRDLCQRHTAKVGQALGDKGDVGRLISLGLDSIWREVGSIGLQQNAIRRDLGQNLSYLLRRTAGHQASNSEIIPAIDPQLPERPASVERMEHNGQVLRGFSQYPGAVMFRGTLMNDDRQSQCSRQFDLGPKRSFLLGSVKPRSKEIEADLSHRYGIDLLNCIAKVVDGGCAEFVCVSRVEADGYRDHGICHLNCSRTRPPAWPVGDVHELLDTSIRRSLNDRTNVVGKGVLVEVDMGVDECGPAARGVDIESCPGFRFNHFTVTLFARLRGLSGSFPRSRATSYPSIWAGNACTSGAASPTSGVGKWTSKTGSSSGPIPMI